LEKTSKQWLFTIIITIINVLTATGYSIAGILSSYSAVSQGAMVSEAAFIFALYAGARTIPLAIITLIAIFKKYRKTVITLGFLAGCIQFIDGFIGIYQQDVLKSAGPFFLAIIQITAVCLAARSNKSISR
jgi:ethanolamine transporter EutH